MAGTLKSLLVKLGVDNSKFNQGMDDAERKTTGLQGNFDKLAKVGMGVTMGVAAGIGATAVALGSTIGPASDLEEAVNAVNVVFGEGAEEIIAYSKNSATAVGLSARSFNQMSAEMGAMLGNVGIAEEDLGTETISLMERASDMASIFNTDVSQAFGAIQSAIKGEFNPLEQFGVKMNQAAIDAKALEMGLADADGQLSDSAKAQAALALVYEQTDKIAGDFQNTSDGLANSQRIRTSRQIRLQGISRTHLMGWQTLNVSLKLPWKIPKPRSALPCCRRWRGLLQRLKILWLATNFRYS